MLRTREQEHILVEAKQSARRILVTHVIISSHIGGGGELLGNINNSHGSL